MEQLQSYYSVILRQSFGIYQMRMFLRVVNRARIITAHKKGLLDYSQGVNVAGFRNFFSVPLSEIAGNTHNYGPLKKNLEAMVKNGDYCVEYYDKQRRQWHIGHMFEDITIDYARSVLNFSVPTWLVQYICDFGNGGYRKYNYEAAMSLSNPYAARLYLLMSSALKPIQYNDIEGLKKILGLSGKYPRVSEFVRKILLPAAEELKKKNLNGYNVEIMHQSREAKRGRIVGLAFFPVKRERKEFNISEQIDDIKKQVPAEMVDYLLQNCHFSVREVAGKNKEYLVKFSLIPDWPSKFQEIIERARRKHKNHGYIISAIKAEVVQHQMQ